MYIKSLSKNFIFATFALALLTACALPASKTPVPDETSSSTAALATLTHQPSLVPSPSSLEYITQNCLVAENEVLLESIAKGTVVFDDLYTTPYLLELETQVTFDLSYETRAETIDFFSFGVDTPPNRDYLAYMEAFRDSNYEPQYFKIRVADSKGKVFAEKTINVNDISPYWRWINKDTIQMFSFSAAQEGAVEFFKPFKNELTKYANVFPDLYQGNYLWPAKYMVEYSPDLEWAIYLTDAMSTSYGPVVLDLTSQQIIWQAAGSAAFTNRPLWSPLGDRVAVVVEGKLFIISRDGQVLSPPALAEDETIEDGKFAWSPNGQYIAFWLIRGADAKLMLYDTQNQKIIDYCIEDLGGGNSLIWSPDGTQFITNVVYQATEDDMGQYSLLVDVKNNKTYKVPSKPIAWMNSEPSP